MKNQILRQLKTINSLSVNTALWVFEKSFGNFFRSIAKLSLEQIDNLVLGLHNQEMEQYWNTQKKMKYPHIFFFGLLCHYKFKTLQEKNYQRESSEGVFVPNSTNDFDKHTLIAEQVTKYVLSMPFDEGVAFLGELIGAWMLTCPEAIIRSENNVEKIGERRVGKETIDWEVPIIWIKRIYPNDESGKTKDKEIQLLYVLDFFLHFTFADYDENNTY